MRLDKRVKDLFRYVGLRSQSLADPTLSYGALSGRRAALSTTPRLGLHTADSLSPAGKCPGKVRGTRPAEAVRRGVSALLNRGLARGPAEKGWIL